MKERLRRFMSGRYGGDNLSRFLNYTALGLVILAMLFNALKLGVIYAILWWLGLGLMIVVLWRTFSRNISKRYGENAKYLALKAKFTGFFKQKAARVKQMKTHRFFKCPKCGQTVRTPKGKGTIRITCPKCHEAFIRKS